MPLFLWSAKGPKGQVEKGEEEAKSKAALQFQLRKSGYRQIKVKKKPIEIVLFPEYADEKDISIFFRQLSTMINAGLPLLQCLQLAEKGADKPVVSKLIRGMREKIETGACLAETLKDFPKEFDSLTCSLVEAGEQGGILDSILLRICSYKEKSLALKAKIKSAMVYPIAIISIAFIVITILMIFVVPTFATMFSSMGKSLPMPTQFVLDLSNFFVAYWYIVLGFPIALLLAIRFMRKSDEGRFLQDKLLLSLPVLGMILRKGAVARFCRTFETLVAAGVPMLDSLRTVAATAGNLVIERAIAEARHAITQGRSLAEPLEESGVFPVMVTQMIAIGEHSGSLDEMLGKIATFYEDEVDTAVENMTALMEPLIMAFLGVTIGGLVIAMYLPIFQMGSLLG